MLPMSPRRANLSLAYFNTAKGNYTFVATAVNTNTHTVKAKVTNTSLFPQGVTFVGTDKNQDPGAAGGGPERDGVPGPRAAG